jgi:hypothetical protein
VKRARRFIKFFLPFLLVEFIQPPARFDALRAGHPLHDSHDFFHGRHGSPGL